MATFRFFMYDYDFDGMHAVRLLAVSCCCCVGVFSALPSTFICARNLIPVLAVISHHG